MSIFEDVTVTWKGNDYTVKADRVMGLVEVVEDVITIEELHGDNIKRAKVSKAFCAILAYAGCRDYSQEQVYNLFFGADSLVDVISVISAILQLMIPPEHLRRESAEEVDQKKD